MKRYIFSLRAITTFNALPPSNHKLEVTQTLDEKMSSFRKRITDLISRVGYDEDSIINFDDTPVWFDKPHPKTIEVIGKKEVSAVKSNNDKHRVIAALAVTKAGRMLPPTIIEKSASKKHPKVLRKRTKL